MSGHLKFKNAMIYLRILFKLDCFCTSPREVRLVLESSFWIYKNISMCTRKVFFGERISEYPFNIIQTVFFSAVKFTRGNWKNMNFLCLEKKSEAIGPGTFNSILHMDRKEIQCIWDIYHISYQFHPLKEFFSQC